MRTKNSNLDESRHGERNKNVELLRRNTLFTCNDYAYVHMMHCAIRTQENVHVARQDATPPVIRIK